MYLDHFTIKDFRNLEKLDMEFDPNVNIFVGNNAQGKTNILEAIYFLALTRSHRTHHIIQMEKTIRHPYSQNICLF